MLRPVECVVDVEEERWYDTANFVYVRGNLKDCTLSSMQHHHLHIVAGFVCTHTHGTQACTFKGEQRKVKGTCIVNKTNTSTH